MVVMRMCIRSHCTINLRDNSSVGKAENWMSAVPLWQGSGPRLTSLVDSTFLSMKMTVWRLIPSGPGYRYLDSWSWHVDYGNITGLAIAIILAICDTFTVVAAS